MRRPSVEGLNSSTLATILRDMSYFVKVGFVEVRCETPEELFRLVAAIPPSGSVPATFPTTLGTAKRGSNQDSRRLEQLKQSLAFLKAIEASGDWIAGEELAKRLNLSSPEALGTLVANAKSQLDGSNIDWDLIVARVRLDNKKGWASAIGTRDAIGYIEREILIESI